MLERIEWNHHIRSWLKLDRYTVQAHPVGYTTIIDTYHPSDREKFCGESVLIRGKQIEPIVSMYVTGETIERGGEICREMNQGHSVCSGCEAVLKDYEPPQDENLLPICYQCKSPVYYSEVQNKGE